MYFRKLQPIFSRSKPQTVIIQIHNCKLRYVAYRNRQRNKVTGYKILAKTPLFCYAFVK